MKKLIIGTLLAVMTIGVATSASAEVIIRGDHDGYRHHERHAVVIRERGFHRDRGWHRGWEHSRHRGVRAKVVIR